MTKQKTSSKKQSFVIAILAVLLVGLLAFNITYAFFTDRETNTDNFTFGTINLESTGDNVITVNRQNTPIDTPVMPGDVLKGSFNLALAEGSEDAFVRYKLSATPEYKYVFDQNSVNLKNSAAVTGGQGYAVVAYINGELIQASVAANGEDVTVYKDGAAEDLVAGDDDDLISAITGYDTFVTFTDGDITYEVTFDASSNTHVETTVELTDNNTGDGDSSTTWTTTDNQAEVEALLIEAKKNFDKKTAIQEAITALNTALQSSASLTTIGTDFTAPGDGYVYKNVALTTESSVTGVGIEYTLPLGLGNALQGVTINLDLIVEAVQAANVESVDPAEDIKDNYKTIFDGLSLSGSEPAYNAIVMFYAAESEHKGILENE